MATNFKRASRQITLSWARLSFPSVWEPKQVVFNGVPRGVHRFSCFVVLTEASVEKIRALEAEIIKESWPDGIPEGVKLESCLRKGDVHRPGDTNLAGKYFLSANSTPKYPENNTDPNSEANKGIVEDARPRVYVKDTKNNILTETHDRSLVYSGCEAHVNVGIFSTQLKATEPQIDCGLNMIQLTGRPFPRFDNRPDADTAFQDISDEAPPPPEGAPDPGSDASSETLSGPPTVSGEDAAPSDDFDLEAELGL